MTKNHKKYLFTVCLFVVFTSAIIPQKNKLKFEHLSIEHGLSNKGVFSIIQDKKGFLWFGTFDGLNKYDGYTFTAYKTDPQDIQSLSDNKVSSIIEDQNGMLWIGTYIGGLNRFDPEKESFTRYTHNPNDSNSLNENGIITLYEDQEGVIWIGTYSALNKFVPATERFTHYKHDPNNTKSLGENEVLAIYGDRSGVLWIGTNGGGLNKFDRKKETFTHYKHDPNDPHSLGNNRIHSIIEDRTGMLWIGTNDGGLNKFDWEKEIFTRYKHEPDDPKSISSNFVGDIYEDQSGILWIGTNDGGLNKFDRGKEIFTHYKHIPNNPKSLSDNRVLSIFEDRSGVLWIGTNNGLNKILRSKDFFTHFNHNPDDPKSLSNNRVYPIFEDHFGMIWIGTFGGGLNKFDREKETFTHYKHNLGDPKSLSDNRVLSIFEDRSGVLWIGTLGGGLNKFNREKETFTQYRHDPNDPKSLSEDEVLTIYEDRAGVLWIGTDQQGLNKFDREKEIFTHYKHDPNDPKSLSYNSVGSIYQDQSGVLWIGTYGGGLNKFDRESETFQKYSEKDGLPDNVIYGILEDDNRNLWLSTNKGLSKFNPNTEQFKNYTIKDGLQNNEFNQGAYLKSRSGEFYFGGVNGFNIFYPDSIKDNPYVPPVIITDFQIFNKSVPILREKLSEEGIDTLIIEKHISEIDELILSYEESMISFEFSALDYTNPEKNRYSYMMEGFDKDWNYTDSKKRFATYTNLDPGEYTFRVKGSNNDGVWNEEGTSISITILPPWWRTTWAYLFYTMLAVGLVYSLFKLKMRRVKLKHEYEMSRFEAKKLHEVDEMKSRFFANISHEFRTPLTLILGPVKEFIQGEKDSKKKKELSIIYRNAERLNNLVNQLLDLSKLEAGKMKLETYAENIIPLLKGLVLSFASLAERKKIQLNFNSGFSELTVYLDRDKIEKIINNLLSNAFKFTMEGGTIGVTVNKTAKAAEIIISDNGIGIPEDRLQNIFNRFYQVDGSHTREQEGTGIGLALTKELVNLHKGEIEVKSKEGKGTTFIIKLPLGKAHLKSEEILAGKKEKVEAISPFSGIIPEEETPKERMDIELYMETDVSAGKAGKPLLLIVEDNTDVRNYIKGYLENEYRILEAKDGKEGLEKAVEHIPDLIVSDVMMPRLDGFQLCEKIKTDERTSHIPLILLTAKASGRDKIEGLETGADDYIMKPFDAKELVVRVKNLIAQREKIIEHFKRQGLFEISNLQIASRDKKFISKAIDIINENISAEDFDVTYLAKEIGLSRVQLHRKLVALIGHSPGDVIRLVRLTKAAKLIQSKFGNISEIALEVGFNNPANFAKAFRAHFGVSPSEYKKDPSA